MSTQMIVVFMVDNDFDNLYFTTSENYSHILDSHNITEDRVKFKTVPMETLLLMLDGQLKFVVR